MKMTALMLGAVTLAACAAPAPTTEPTPSYQQPAYPRQHVAPRRVYCERYAEVLAAIEHARHAGGDGQALDAAERTTLRACNPRNKRARAKAERALETVREMDRVP